MNELKMRTMEVIDCINNEWVNALKEAEEKGTGIDMTAVMGKYSGHLKKLDQYFMDAVERQKRGSKKGLFGF